MPWAQQPTGAGEKTGFFIFLASIFRSESLTILKPRDRQICPQSKHVLETLQVFWQNPRLNPNKANTVQTRTLLLAFLLTLTPVAFAQTAESVQTIEELQACAELGDPECQAGLGAMYFAGLDVPQNYEEAEQWLRLSAEQGNADGAAALGLMYKNGEGLPQDDIQAYKWLQIAAFMGADKASLIRDFMAESMTPEQVAEAQRLAGEWRPKQ